jgi:hypothetical protein
MDIDVTRERLVKLGLTHAAEQLATWLGEAVAEEMPPHRFLDRMLEQELRARDERRIRTSLVLSGLPTGQTLANFDFAFQPALERSRIETLATGQWIRENPPDPGPANSLVTSSTEATGAEVLIVADQLRKHCVTNSGNGRGLMLRSEAMSLLPQAGSRGGPLRGSRAVPIVNWIAK